MGKTIALTQYAYNVKEKQGLYLNFISGGDSCKHKRVKEKQGLYLNNKNESTRVSAHYR